MFNYELPNLDKLISDASNLHSPKEDYLLRQLHSLTTQKQNLHGRRVGKAKDAISPGDYVTKRQINGNLFGTLAARPQPTNVAPGTTYFASDRNVTYQMRNGHWWYKDGIQDVTLSPNTKPSPSVLYDNGYMIYATDFDWYYRWNLITWERLHGVNRYIEGFRVAPTKVGWGLCDGTTYTCSTDSGGTTTVTTDNLNGTARFVKYGSTYTTEAAVAPTLAGSTASGGSHSHTVTATGSVTGTAALPDLSHGHDSSSLTVDIDALTFTGSVSTTTVTGSVVAQNPFDCTTYVEWEIEMDFNGSNAVICGATYELSSASLADGTVTGDIGGSVSVSGSTGGALGFTEGGLDIAITATFTGDSNTTSDHTGHTHGAGTLAVSDTGTPIAIQLIPYIRL